MNEFTAAAQTLSRSRHARLPRMATPSRQSLYPQPRMFSVEGQYTVLPWLSAPVRDHPAVDFMFNPEIAEKAPKLQIAASGSSFPACFRFFHHVSQFSPFLRAFSVRFSLRFALLFRRVIPPCFFRAFQLPPAFPRLFSVSFFLRFARMSFGLDIQAESASSTTT